MASTILQQQLQWAGWSQWFLKCMQGQNALVSPLQILAQKNYGPRNVKKRKKSAVCLKKCLKSGLSKLLVQR